MNLGLSVIFLTKLSLGSGLRPDQLVFFTKSFLAFSMAPRILFHKLRAQMGGEVILLKVDLH